MNLIANQPIMPLTCAQRWPLLLVLVTLWLQTPAARAHRLDELLQAALITIEPDAIRLELNLTPGVETFPTLLPLLDLDHDGHVSDLEADAYADLVRSELSLHLDERLLVLQVTDFRFPLIDELRTGLGTIRLKLSAGLNSISVGTHEIQFKNRHRPDQSIYLVNAVMPKSRAVQVTRQRRNDNQSQSRIAFTLVEGSVPVSTGNPEELRTRATRLSPPKSPD